MNMNNSQINQVFIGRQPIFDNKMRVYAYELLFRDRFDSKVSNVDNDKEKDGDSATINLILSAFGDLGLDNLIGSKLAFINLTKNLVLNLPPIPKEKVVLELLESIQIDKEVIGKVRELNKQGYIIALDDFEFKTDWKPLLNYTKIVKIDIQEYSKEELQKNMSSLSEYDIKFLAEKVETYEDFEFCKNIGFWYFQGYFLSKPKLVSGKKTATNKLVVMQLISALSKPAITMEKIEQLLSEDPKLSYKLLRIINSAALFKVRRIESLHQAVVYLGIDKLKEWATLISLSSVDDKPHELMVTTMVRAKMCEILATKAGFADSDLYFTAGLFSTLNAVMDDDLEVLLQKLSISDEIKEGLLLGKGNIGEILKDVIHYENARWDELSDKFSTADYSSSYMLSVDWANEACAAIAGA